MPKLFFEPTLPNKAPLLRRITAFAIDISISFAIALLINIFWGQFLFTDATYTSQIDLGKDFSELANRYGNKGFIFGLTFILIFFRDLIGGRSLGKKVMKLVIIHKTSDTSARYARTFMRSMIPFTAIICLTVALLKTEYMLHALSAIGLLDLILLSAQSNHRGLGDFFMDTVVMIERRSKPRPRNKK